MRNYRYDRSLKTSILLDDFGDPYYALDDEDLTINISVSLPISLVRLLDRRRGKISRSRFMRRCVENELDVIRV